MGSHGDVTRRGKAIAIVGGGIAGVAAAEALRLLGHSGPVRLFAAESAIPYDRPTLSKGFLAGPGCIEPPDLRPRAIFDQLRVQLDLGTQVKRIHREQQLLVTAEGERVPYDQLLLATGARPRRLDLPGSALIGVHYLREVDGARVLRAALRRGGSVAVIGGGVIGLEVAASARKLGATATVIEVGPRLMARIAPAALGRHIETLHRARGIRVLTGTRAVAFEGAAGRIRGVELDDGQFVNADTIVVGVGVVPRTELADEAGVLTDDGVLVDGGFRSSDERIFAAGDVARVFHVTEQRHIRVEQWRPAEEQARQAAASMVGAGGAYHDVPWMWSDQADLHVQASGFGFVGVDVVARGAVQDPAGLTYFGVRNGVLTAACGLSVGTGVARTIKAAHMLIERGVDVDAEQLADTRFDLRRFARRKALGDAA